MKGVEACSALLELFCYTENGYFILDVMVLRRAFSGGALR